MTDEQREGVRRLLEAVRGFGGEVECAREAGNVYGWVVAPEGYNWVASDAPSILFHLSGSDGERRRRSLDATLGSIAEGVEPRGRGGVKMP